MPWPFKQYGSTTDPIHKSHLNELTGEYGCPRRFRYQRDAEHAAERGEPDPTGRTPSSTTRVNGPLACGTAVHETIARALNNPAARADLLSPRAADHSELVGGTELGERVRRTFEHELRIAADGRELDFGKDDPAEEIAERVVMAVGLLRSLHRYVRRVIAVEPGFIVELEGVWYSGHVDLIYEPVDAPGEVAICDWKTGATKPHPIELAHGWEGGVYALACERGVFLPRESVVVKPNPNPSRHGAWLGVVDYAAADGFQTIVVRQTPWQAERDGLETALKHIATGTPHPSVFQVGRYPARVYHVHLRDFVPYQKSGTKEAKRAEDLAFYRLERPAKVKYVAGHLRGPAWLPVELHEHDVARLAYRARNVIGTVRMGRFPDYVREHCQRCPFARDCLTDGYAPRGEDLAALESQLKQAGL